MLRTIVIFVASFAISYGLLASNAPILSNNNLTSSCFYKKEAVKNAKSRMQTPVLVCPSDKTLVAQQFVCEAFVDYELSFDTDNCTVDTVLLKHNLSEEVSLSFDCDSETSTSHLRVFDLNEFGVNSSIFVNSVDIGIGFVNTNASVTIRLYTLQGELTYGNMTLIASEDVVLPNIFNDIYNVPISATLPAGSVLVAELVTGGGVGSTIAGYNIDEGQTAPSYIYNSYCGLDNPTDLTELGQGDIALVMQVNLSNVLVTQTGGLPSGSIFPVGTTTNTFEATDVLGNTTNCSFDVNILDEQAPLLVCPTNILEEVTEGSCGAFVDYQISTVENCPDETITQLAGLPSGAFFPIGTTLNIFSVVDQGGNVDTCRFDVTIIDQELPVIVCPPNVAEVLATDACSAFVDYEIMVFDNCGIESLEQISGIGSGLSFPVGRTTNTFILSDLGGNQAACSFDVNVVENTAPMITNCPVDITQSVDAGACDAIVNYDAIEFTDNCDLIHYTMQQHLDEIVTASYGCPESGASKHLRAFNLEAMGIVNALEIDSVRMGIGFAQNSPSVTLNLYTLDGAISYSNMDLIASSTQVLPDLLDGYHIFPITASVPAGAIIVVEFIVPVEANAPFIAGYNEAAQSAPSYYASQGCGYNDIVDLADAGFPDFSLIVSLFGKGRPQFLVNRISGLESGSAFPIGTTTNTYVVEDGSGNQTTCSFDITILDEGPLLSCPANITASISDGNCQMNLTIGIPTAVDNCGNVVNVVNDYTGVLDASGIYLVGMTIVTWTATDDAGNTSTCQTIVELTSPNINATVTANPVSCFGGNDGTASIMAENGVAPYIYEWETGETTASIENLSAGAYTVTMVDADGCQFIGNAIVEEPEMIRAVGQSITPAFGMQNNGVITLNIAGGTPPYSFLWSNAETTESIVDLMPGAYTLTVTDNADCEQIIGPFIIEDVVTTESVSLIEALAVYPNPARDFIVIDYELTRASTLDIYAFNGVGQLIENRSIEAAKSAQYTIDCSDWTSGIYFIKVALERESIFMDRVLVVK